MPEYSPEIATKILTRIANGESVREICRDENMPNREAIRDWRVKYPEFGDGYLKAKAICADESFEEIEHIIDRSENDFQLAKNRYKVDAIKWKLAKMMPKKYGDRPEDGPQVGNDLNQKTENELTAVLLQKVVSVIGADKLIKLLGEKNANEG